MNIQNIAKRFDRLLEIDEKEINYSLHIDAEHGVGFFPINESTIKAMSEISKGLYEIILDDLVTIAKDTEFGQGYNLRREQIFYT